LKLSAIKPNPNNPRLIKDEKFSKLVKSINDFPKMMELRPMIIDDDNVILGGNMRFRALQELKMKDIPDNWVKKASDLTDDEKKQFIIKDNVGFGEWDLDELANNWNAEDLEKWGLEIPNFTTEPEQVQAVEDDYDIPDTIKTDIVLGDLFEIGQHRLLCGDSTKIDDVEKLMNGKKADMIFTDPPYSVNFTKKAKEVLKSKNYVEIANDNMTVKDTSEQLWKPYFNICAEISKDDTSIYCTMPQGGDQMMMMMMMMSEGWQVKHELIWVKEAPVFSMGRLDYDYKHEPIAYGWKKKHKFYGKGEFTKSVWEIPRIENKLHPTMKPVRLIANAINNSSLENEVIYDGFGGSGSTMVACHQTKRICYMQELDPKYCQVIVDRMLKLDPTLEIKRNGEKYINNCEKAVKNG
jgi:DNA modification methylase